MSNNSESESNPQFETGNPAAVPAPAVVSEVINVQPAPAPTLPDREQLEAAPAMSAPQAQVETASLPAQGMDVAFDPASLNQPLSAPSPSPADPAAPVVPLPENLRSAPYPPRNPQSQIPNPQSPRRSNVRLIVGGIGLLVFAGAGGYAVVSVRDGMERARIEKEIAELMAVAQSKFDAGDLQAAKEEGLRAGQKIDDASGRKLDAVSTEQWKARIKQYKERSEEAETLAQIIAQARKEAGKDAGATVASLLEAQKSLETVRGQIENKMKLYGPPSPDNRALLDKAADYLAEIDALFKKNKIRRLVAEQKDADALYMSGDIEGAGKRASELQEQMKAKPAVEDADLAKRLSVLYKRSSDFREIKEARANARSNYAEARNRLQSELKKLDAANDDLKPLVKRIAELKNSLIQEEKKSRKLTPEQTQQVQKIAKLLASRDKNIVTGELEGDSQGLSYDKRPLRVGLQQTELGRELFLEVEDNRMTVQPLDLDQHTTRVLRHVLELGAAMKKAGVQSDELWNASEETPMVSARRIAEDGQVHLFMGDRLYVGKPPAKAASEGEVKDDFRKKTEALALAVESDMETPEEVRQVVAVAVRAAYKDADWHDHLPGKFVRKVVADGYIEANMPGSAQRLEKALGGYRKAYAEINHPSMSFSGSSAHGDEAVEFKTFENHSVWKLYSKSADTTSFAIKNPDSERDALFILYDFPGKLSEYPALAGGDAPGDGPAGPQPKTVRMTHQAIGVTATYDVAAGKLDFDPARWNEAVILEAPMIPMQIRTERGLGPPEWSLPPHVLLVDVHANTQAVVTPFGRLDVQDFGKIADPARRTQAMEEFLNKMAKALPTAEYLHLYFRYFQEYNLDSPITSKTALLGSRDHSGDIHQTTEQSLQRFTGGRYVGDCDDLAEFFMNVTRRQGKLSYVMSLPQHAACGWVEKQPGTGYTFYVIDTGPPRMFSGNNLDKVIEMAFRAYDPTQTMRFDPKSLGFLFRFNNEPTRSPYWLSSRMYLDREYGEVMERVQGYWHFHFYALGIQKMTEMIEKGDRVPENCVELAGLYGQVRENEESIRWTREAIKQLSPEEKLSRLNEEWRVAFMWREDRNFEKAYEVASAMAAELKELQKQPDGMKYFSVRLQLMGLLEQIDRPFEAWDLVKPDMERFANPGPNMRPMLRIEHAGGLTTLYRKMKDLVEKGKTLSEKEKTGMARLEFILNWFYAGHLFQPEDDFNDYMRNYAFVGLWYAGKYGKERLLQELLKDGPFPDPAKKRDHRNRKDKIATEAEDWPWIRLALPSYSIAIGDALDLDDPPEKWRRDDAVKLADAMVRASEHARQFGSLGNAEFSVLSARCFRAFLKKDWEDLDKVFQVVRERNWARLTDDICDTMGRSARFVTPEEFAAQYKVLCRHIKARTAYFTVIYEAYRSEAIEHAVAASKVALECWPDDEDMKREAVFLEQLAKKKQARKAAAVPQPK